MTIYDLLFLSVMLENPFLNPFLISMILSPTLVREDCAKIFS